MRREQPRHTGQRRRVPWMASPSRGSTVGAPGRLLAGVGGRRATRPGRFGLSRSPARRRKQSSGGSAMAFARGRLGGVGKHQPSKRSRTGPALLAVVAGLGVAGAAAIKRRRGEKAPSAGHMPPPEPVGEPTPTAEASPPPEAA
jgi:hypothetical protein